MTEQIITAAQPLQKQKKTMNRTTYSMFTVLFLVTFIVLRIICKAADQVAASAYEPGGVFICQMLHFLPPITVFLFTYFCMPRRLRDCGKNPYYAWFILIPLFGLAYVIYLCFASRKTISQN
ncbi:DUF805 domain-containing protein [uncultured Succinivibrio sp.]|uniref:DUF805 domain-containing protein n=1 Tax=uncultured Succinivibrio sp. TaxID=540749 RepID=UPI0025CCD67B|nr:DUF805 domain-containing protein [uncultured Succinivibrio sp.]